MTMTDDAERKARLLVLGADAGNVKRPPRRVQANTVRSSLSEELIATETETRRREDVQPKPSL